MQRNFNIVGQNVAKFRRQRGWSQEELAIKLQLLGFIITRQILANVETHRCAVTDTKIVLFAEVLSVQINDLFPSKLQSNNRRPSRRNTV